MTAEETDVFVRPAVGVVPVDPKESDRPGPAAGELARVGAMRLDTALDAGVAERGAKVVPRGLLRAVAVVRRRRCGMGIDRDDRPQPVSLSDRREPDGRLSLVAADFENHTLRGGAAGDQRQKARFALGQESRGRADPRPRLVDGVGQVRWLTADG